MQYRSKQRIHNRRISDGQKIFKEMFSILSHQENANEKDFRKPDERLDWENARRKQDEGQKEGSCMAEDYAVDIEHESSNRFEEYEWCEQKWIRATTLLDGGFRGSGFVMCKEKEPRQ